MHLHPDVALHGANLFQNGALMPPISIDHSINDPHLVHSSATPLDNGVNPVKKEETHYDVHVNSSLAKGTDAVKTNNQTNAIDAQGEQCIKHDNKEKDVRDSGDVGGKQSIQVGDQANIVALDTEMVTSDVDEEDKFDLLIFEKVVVKLIPAASTGDVKVTLKVSRRTRKKLKKNFTSTKITVKNKRKGDQICADDKTENEIPPDKQKQKRGRKRGKKGDTDATTEQNILKEKVEARDTEKNNSGVVKKAMSAKLAKLREQECQRLAFGKSAIQGWGLIAQQNFKESDFVVEYRGQLVRHSVANLLEEKYVQAGKACYLFAVDDEFVVDATECGNLGRFINHSYVLLPFYQ